MNFFFFFFLLETHVPLLPPSLLAVSPCWKKMQNYINLLLNLQSERANTLHYLAGNRHFCPSDALSWFFFSLSLFFLLPSSIPPALLLFLHLFLSSFLPSVFPSLLTDSNNNKDSDTYHLLSTNNAQGLECIGSLNAHPVSWIFPHCTYYETKA